MVASCLVVSVLKPLTDPVGRLVAAEINAMNQSASLSTSSRVLVGFDLQLKTVPVLSWLLLYRICSPSVSLEEV